VNVKVALDVHAASRILVLRLDAIGDVVLTSPFLRELRRSAPQARITLVVNREIHNLVELCPYVNEVLVFDRRPAGGFARPRRYARGITLAAKLWRRRFDLAILPRWGPDHYRATHLAYLSGAVRRIAYSERSSGLKALLNRGYDRLLTQAVSGAGVKHEVERNLDLLRFLEGEVEDSRLELWLAEEDRTFARQILGERSVQDGELLLAFAPGAGEKKRCWPVDRWIELGRRLRQEYALRIVLVGGNSEAALGKQIEDALGDNVINLTGRATLRQTGAILERCLLTVSNDSGPVHLAAAAGSPVVEISCHPRGGDPEHHNSPTRFGPWQVPHIVSQPESTVSCCKDSCTADVPHCILGIEVAEVQKAVRKLLSSEAVETSKRGSAANDESSKNAKAYRPTIATASQSTIEG
jgi:ADP-heptose:LPS heptosyltransferase